MKNVSLSVKCTREEYMEFCVNRHKPMAWLTVVGILLVGCGAAVVILGGELSGGVLLLLLGGVVSMMLSPLILPMMRKGEAARRYDASDSLKSAVSVTVDERGITVSGATIEGTLPVDALTEVVETSSMLALVFGREYTLCIPKRALLEEELSVIKDLTANN